MHQSFNELEIRVKGMRLTALAFGDPAGEPLLALHGWLDNAASFLCLAEQLSHYRWVALDFPGHGHSQHRPVGAHYHASDYVSDALGALDALGWHEKTKIVGHSLGAGVASLLAAAAPERVAKLALIDGAGTWPGDPGSAAKNLGKGSRALLDLKPTIRRHFATVEEAVANRAAATPGVGALVLRAIVERNITAVGDGFGFATDKRLRMPSVQPYCEEAVLSMLGNIESPTLVIEASESYLRSSNWLERRCAAIKGVERRVLSGTHHLHTCDETVSDVAVAIGDFFSAEPH